MNLKELAKEINKVLGRKPKALIGYDEVIIIRAVLMALYNLNPKMPGYLFDLQDELAKQQGT